MRGGLTLRLAERRLAGWGRGVLVLGMHRSGTSAVTRVVNLLGVPLCDPADFVTSDQDDNPSGFWESRRLVAVNDQVLAHFGGTWAEPPELPPGWAALPGLAPLRREARRCFALSYPTREWVWKDPRACLTLPFWRSLLRGRLAAIVVVRHPLEVARSLEKRNRMPLAAGLALWDRYMRDAVAGLGDLPALYVHYDSLLEDPRRVAAGIRRFLAAEGFAVHDASPDALAAFIDEGLRHSRLRLDDLAAVATAGQVSFYREMLARTGRSEPEAAVSSR